MPKKDKTSWKTRAPVIFAMFLLVGSPISFYLLNMFSPQQQGFSIPQERILNYKLSQDQIDFLLSRYFTIVEYDYPPNCFDCLEVKNVLEEATLNSDNQIFLQEIEITDTKPVLYISNALNETTIEEPTPDDVTESICKILISAPMWCVINQV